MTRFDWHLWYFAMFTILIPVVAYGWGYRGWGPPFPRFIQRRRANVATGPSSATAETMDGRYTAFNPEGWGWVGDLVWFSFAIALFGVLSLNWWL
jgi:hypothetical protein